MALLALGVGLFVAVGGSSSSADVTAVDGSAYGYSLSVSIFGSPPFIRPCENPPTNTIGCGPAPAVALPAGGSATPVTANAATGDARAGPAVFFTSGPIIVSTEGRPGPTGSVTSSTEIATLNTSGQESITADSVASTCTASETDVSGTTTITNGTLVTDNGDNVPNDPIPDHPPVIVPIPVNPAPNTEFTGHVHVNGTTDNFRVVFNEQVMTADSITVNAAHQYLEGPTAIGELIIGQSVCDVTVVPGTTTTTQPTGTTTTTQPTGTTTTTQPTGTTTTTTTPVVPGIDCATVAPRGTTPTATVDPNSVVAGSNTTVTGGGFTPGELLDIGLCSSPVRLASVTADASGGFQATVTVPAGTSAGAHTIVVSSADRSRIAIASITVVAPAGGGTTGGTVRGSGLARTGAENARMAGLAALALIMGAVLVRSARKTRRWPYRSTW